MKKAEAKEPDGPKWSLNMMVKCCGATLQTPDMATGGEYMSIGKDWWDKFEVVGKAALPVTIAGATLFYNG